MILEISFNILQISTLGLLFNVPLLFIILKKKLLSMPYGVISGAITTLTIFIISPFLWVALVVFFLSSSFLSKWRIKEKRQVYQEFAKGSRRDAIQVLANSIASIIFGLLHFLTIFNVSDLNNNIAFTISPWLIAAFATIATHNADTWMTEVGITSNHKTRLITNLRKVVPKGTSGGISIQGTFAGVLGSLLIAIVFGVSAILISDFTTITVIISVIILTFAGVVGGMVDSFEGATIQKLYYCDRCEKETETNPHKCGEKTRYYRGYRIFTNDFVNFNSALVSGILTFSLISIII